MSNKYICRVCKAEKDKVCFYGDNSRKSGVMQVCKECDKKRQIVKRRKKSKLLRSSYLTPGSAYRSYRAGAIKRGVSFNLDREYFEKKYGKTSCHYCGDSITTIGFDRVNNMEGYNENNVVASCKTCNQFKRSRSYKTFISQCIKIANHFSRN